MKTNIPSTGPRIGRRSVLVLGGAATTAALAGLTPKLAQATEPGAIRYVVTDRRYEESLAFGEALVRQGATRLELTDGLTRLWQEVLSPHWRDGTGGVAGLTAMGAWHGLSEQARGQARRSALIGRHAIGPQSAGAEHIVTAPAPVLAATLAAAGLDQSWPRTMAAVMNRCSTAPRQCDAQWRNEAQFDAEARRYSLVSWIIA
jgi:hypothetical protein